MLSITFIRSDIRKDETEAKNSIRNTTDKLLNGVGQSGGTSIRSKVFWSWLSGYSHHMRGECPTSVGTAQESSTDCSTHRDDAMVLLYPAAVSSLL